MSIKVRTKHWYYCHDCLACSGLNFLVWFIVCFLYVVISIDYDYCRYSASPWGSHVCKSYAPPWPEIYHPIKMFGRLCIALIGLQEITEVSFVSQWMLTFFVHILALFSSTVHFLFTQMLDCLISINILRIYCLWTQKWAPVMGGCIPVGVFYL